MSTIKVNLGLFEQRLNLLRCQFKMSLYGLSVPTAEEEEGVARLIEDVSTALAAGEPGVGEGEKLLQEAAFSELAGPLHLAIGKSGKCEVQNIWNRTLPIFGYDKIVADFETGRPFES